MSIRFWKRGLLTVASISILSLSLLACGYQQPLAATASVQTAADGSVKAADSGTLPDAAAGFAPISFSSEAAITVSENSSDSAAPEMVGIVGPLATTTTTTAQATGAGQTGLHVSGRGIATGMPDIATLNLGVTSFAGTVGEARTEAAEAMAAVLTALKEAGIEDRDVQTSHFNIAQRHSSREVTICPQETGEGTETMPGSEDSMTLSDGCYQEWQSVVTGYEVANSLVVQVRNLDSVGSVIDQAVAAGGDLIQFSDISFAVEDTTELQKQARAAAMADLKDRAEQLAALGDVDLGALVFLTETSYAAPRRVAPGLETAMAADDGSFTPISRGEVSVEINVAGVFAMR